MEDRKIGIAIPTFNRYEMTIESFIDVYGDPRIESITIVDDASDLETFHKLKEICDKLSKVRLRRNVLNKDCYLNKATALTWSDQQWNILLDSDNVIGADYLNILYEIPQWCSETFYTPSFARPHFDFRPYAGLILNRENIPEHIDKPMLETCLNAANYFIHQNTWLRAFDESIDPVTSDSLFISYRHILQGGSIEIVDGLEYEHRVHEGSHYVNNVSRTPHNFHESILNNLRGLK